MARIRSLHPDFFIDDDLKNFSFENRLIFAGLWCYADKEGRLEDKPEKLKVQIMPYDKIDMNKCLEMLAKYKKPLINRYSTNNKKYIQIITWNKYQKPHHTERASVIPAPPISDDIDEITVKEPLNNGALTCSKDSLFIVQIHGSDKDINQHFDKCWSLYPVKLGKKEAYRHYKASVKTTQDRSDIETAIRNYRQQITEAKTERQYIKHGSTFFNNWQDYVLDINAKPISADSEVKRRYAAELERIMKEKEKEIKS